MVDEWIAETPLDRILIFGHVQFVLVMIDLVRSLAEYLEYDLSDSGYAL